MSFFMSGWRGAMKAPGDEGAAAAKRPREDEPASPVTPSDSPPPMSFTPPPVATPPPVLEPPPVIQTQPHFPPNAPAPGCVRGVGGVILGAATGEMWGAVKAEMPSCWQLDNGRVVRKETEGVKWHWRLPMKAPPAPGNRPASQLPPRMPIIVQAPQQPAGPGNLAGTQVKYHTTERVATNMSASAVLREQERLERMGGKEQQLAAGWTHIPGGGVAVVHGANTAVNPIAEPGTPGTPGQPGAPGQPGQPGQPQGKGGWQPPKLPFRPAGRGRQLNMGIVCTTLSAAVVGAVVMESRDTGLPPGGPKQKVRVKQSIAVPQHGWGDVKPGDVGHLTRVTPTHVVVRFKFQEGWRAAPTEIEQVTEHVEETEKKPAELAKLRPRLAALIGRKDMKGVENEENAVSCQVRAAVRNYVQSRNVPALSCKQMRLELEIEIGQQNILLDRRADLQRWAREAWHESERKEKEATPEPAKIPPEKLTPADFKTAVFIVGPRVNQKTEKGEEVNLIAALAEFLGTDLGWTPEGVIKKMKQWAEEGTLQQTTFLEWLEEAEKAAQEQRKKDEEKAKAKAERKRKREEAKLKKDGITILPMPDGAAPAAADGAAADGAAPAAAVVEPEADPNRGEGNFAKPVIAYKVRAKKGRDVNTLTPDDLENAVRAVAKRMVMEGPKLCKDFRKVKALSDNHGSLPPWSSDRQKRCGMHCQIEDDDEEGAVKLGFRDGASSWYPKSCVENLNVFPEIAKELDVVLDKMQEIIAGWIFSGEVTQEVFAQWESESRKEAEILKAASMPAAVPAPAPAPAAPKTPAPAAGTPAAEMAKEAAKEAEETAKVLSHPDAAELPDGGRAPAAKKNPFLQPLPRPGEKTGPVAKPTGGGGPTRAELKAQLNEWTRNFKEREGRRPTKKDIETDPAFGPVYQQYLKSAGGAAAPKPAPEKDVE
eukprot:Hpha_TRINITY_DN16622_c4_g11::TRINITY_DN16622_c4_g11_i1::g.182006::m.182006